LLRNSSTFFLIPARTDAGTNRTFCVAASLADTASVPGTSEPNSTVRVLRALGASASVHSKVAEAAGLSRPYSDGLASEPSPPVRFSDARSDTTEETANDSAGYF
jgi:hypothetical protein